MLIIIYFFLQMLYFVERLKLMDHFHTNFEMYYYFEEEVVDSYLPQQKYPKF